MKFVYCKINMGVIQQDIMLVDTDVPSLEKLGSCKVEDLGNELIHHCYAQKEYNVKLEGNPEFYKAIVGKVNTYDKDKQIKFIK